MGAINTVHLLQLHWEYSIIVGKHRHVFEHLFLLVLCRGPHRQKQEKSDVFLNILQNIKKMAKKMFLK